MHVNADDPTCSPAPLDLLVSTLSPRVLLEIIKADPFLSGTVLQGFTARANSMAQPVVRQRLERELARRPELATQLFERWQEQYGVLQAQVNALEFDAGEETLRMLAGKFGCAVVQYALLHAERPDIRDAAACVPDPRAKIPTPSPRAQERDAPRGKRGHDADLHQRLREAEEQTTALQHALDDMSKELDRAHTREDTLRRQSAQAEERIEREQRRARKHEEDAERLRKGARANARTVETNAAAVPAEALDAISEAISLLQRSLTVLRPATPSDRREPSPVPAPPPSRPTPPRVAEETTITLPGTRGKQTYHVSQVFAAFVHNDATQVHAIRDGLARLAQQPEREKAIITELGRAGIPRPVLVGPLRPAVADGSNIANMSPQSRGRLAYLAQIRRSAWEEGYFPVLMVVDASLRYQIDQPDRLMEMVESGEITMAPPGTSADELMIEEATQRGAVLLTNDRMADWPTAKHLDKRHIERMQDGVRVGPFHRSARWFPW